MPDALLAKIQRGDIKSLSRAISFVENEVQGYQEFLRSLPFNRSTKITGITGPPGAGKSTVTDHLIGLSVAENKKVAVLCTDPSSPFTDGALLGDRIRMRTWFNHPSVFIRSLSSRGMLGGLNPLIVEICDVVKAAGFDQIFIETVGVGQNETAIAALADCSVVLLVPEGGDDIQTMKSGLLEVADIFAVNKCDRPGGDLFIKNLKDSLHEGSRVLKLIASENKGIEELYKAINEHLALDNAEKKFNLLAELAYQIAGKNFLKKIDKGALKQDIIDNYDRKNFNLYSIVQERYPSSAQ